jgi:hypothetical protein
MVILSSNEEIIERMCRESGVREKEVQSGGTEEEGIGGAVGDSLFLEPRDGNLDG